MTKMAKIDTKMAEKIPLGTAHTYKVHINIIGSAPQAH